MKKTVADQVEKEAILGIAPVLRKEKIYGFMDAFLVLSGYCIATWSYTQGSYLTTLVGFKQLLLGVFLGAVLMLIIYQLPVILSVRYGIDIWIWLRSVFGVSGVKLITVIIIVINFPWYAVCADLFASSMTNLAALFSVHIPDGAHVLLAVACVLAGTLIAYKGIGTITWTTRLLVPLLLALGVMAVIIGFTSVPFEAVWNYRPVRADGDSTGAVTYYIMSVEANFAFVITLIGGMAEIPRLTKKEKSGFWAGVLGQGLSGSLFVLAGAVMAIAMQYVTGQAIEDPTLMLATLSVPALALSSLMLVAFANIGTQAVGSYIYGVMLKSSFPRVNYNMLILLLALYVTALCVWGKIIDYFGSFLEVCALVYAPLAALLFADFFFVRKQKLALRSAFALPGYRAYHYTRGFNCIGFVCMAGGIAMSLLVYNPITKDVYIPLLFYLTPTGLAFMGTGALYYGLSCVPAVRRYLLRDRNELTIKPFDRFKIPPKQNLFAMPFLWLYSWLATRKGRLTINKVRMKGLKPPFLVLANHLSFTDFYVTPLALCPYRANYVSELEGFEAFGEWIYRQIGCLGTRKFVRDMALVKNICNIIERKGILVLYPEARYANVGTHSKLDMSVAKLAKMLKVPVVVINMRGNYLQSPIWNLRTRRQAKLEATVTQIYTAAELAHASVLQLHSKLQSELSYDEYAWQYKRKLIISCKKRAEGIEQVLYMCPVCRKELSMSAKGSRLSCAACGSQWCMTEHGRMEGVSHSAGFSHIPDWYEWQRRQVEEEVDRGSYLLDIPVRIEALPNAINFIDLGNGRLLHDERGFALTFQDYGETAEKTLFFAAASMSSIHTEYNYRKKGPCVTLSTADNTYFLFPESGEFNVTKIQFATEYLYERKMRGGGILRADRSG